MESLQVKSRLPVVLIIFTVIIEHTTGLVWKECSDPYLQQVNAKCTIVTVPLNYYEHGKENISIAVSRILHTSSAAKYQGVLLVKTGGPQSTSAASISLRERIPKSIAATYDWVSFDLRGTGLTGPSLSCVPDFYPTKPASVVPYNQQLENFWLNRSKHYLQACRKNHASVLPHIHSVFTVLDMESIRKALKADKLHIYASSFGTYISQLYATLYSDKVGKMVLDTPIDSERIWYQRRLDVVIATQKVMNLWYEWVAKYDIVFHLGNQACQVEGRINDVLKELEGKPIAGWVGQTEWINLLGYVVGSPNSWYPVAFIVSAYINDKNSSLVADYALVDSDVDIATDLTYGCNDRPWPTQWDTVKTDLWRTYTRAPLITWADMWPRIPCIFWPYRTTPFLHVNGSQIGNILLTTGTSAANYRKQSIMDIRRRFPRARLITTVNGITLANAWSGNTCVDNVISAYLRNGTVPDRQNGDVADVECARLPLPRPLEEAKLSTSAMLKGLRRELFADFSNY